MSVNNRVGSRFQPQYQRAASQSSYHSLIERVNAMFDVMNPRQDIPYASSLGHLLPHWIPRSGSALAMSVQVALPPLLRWPFRYTLSPVFAVATGTIVWCGAVEIIRGVMTPRDLLIFLAWLA